MNRRLRSLLLGLGIGIGLAVLVVVVILPRFRPHVFSGTVIQSQTPAPTVDLQTSTGARASLSDFEDQVVVIYFGYTFCPDVCPTTLSTLKKSSTYRFRSPICREISWAWPATKPF